MTQSTILAVAFVILFLWITILTNLVSKKTNIPSITLLLLCGILIGPEGFDILDPGMYIDWLSAIVSIGVAIIVFDGGLHIDLKRIKDIHDDAIKLTIIGSIITFIGASIVTRLVMDIPWNLACLYGALVMATGPTVITPIIRNLNLNYRLRKLLEFEGVFNDAFSVILSALMFEWILSGVSTGAGALSFILQRIFFGAMIGIACGTVLYLLYTRLKTVSNQTVRYVTLTMILVCYATAEVLGTESGILAVALFGMILGSTNIPYQSMIKEFKNDIVVFMISLIFVLLAAMIEFDHILTTGIYGLVIVGCIIGVIRPLAVRIALRNSKFNENEKMFVSFIGPKGVVPVSMSVYFALRMSDLGITGGETLVGLMFITVIISVTICGGLSSYVANRFEVIPMSTIIINGDKIGILLADKIHQRGNNVTVLDENSDRCKILEDSGIHAICGDIMDKNILIDMNFDKCQHVIVNTGRDDTNHFICKLLQMHTSISNDKIIVRINDSENNEIFEKMGTRIMNKDVATATILDNMIT